MAGGDTPKGGGVVGISIGELVVGEITDPAEAAEYSFTATPGQRVFLDVLTTSNPGGLVWSLKDVPGRVIVQTTTALTDLGPVYLLGGEYRIRVASEVAGTGTFEFRVEAPAVVTTPISTGVSVAAALTTPGERRDHTFTATAGDRIFIDLLSTSNSGGLNFLLTSPSGRELLPRTTFLGDFGPFGLQGGTYTLSVVGEGDAIGNFEFNVTPVITSDTAVLVGDSIDDAITGAGSVARYSFSASAGQIIELDVLATSSPPGLNFLLEDDFGRAVIPRTFSLTDQPPVALVGGDYVLSVLGEGGATGTYMFDILDGGTSAYAPGGTPISVGGTVIDTIDPGSETDSYGFTAGSGERIYLDLITANFGLRWSLIDPVGTAIFDSATAQTPSQDQGPFQLAAGDYTIEVFAVTGTPAYEFKLWSAIEQISNVALDDNLTNAFTGPGDRHHYDFPIAAASDRIYLDLLSGNTQLRGSLVDEQAEAVLENVLLASTSANDLGPLDLDQGSYRLTLNALGGALPIYSMDLLDVSDIDGGPIFLGMPVMDTVPGAGGSRRYSLTIAGEPKIVSFDLTGAVTLRFSAVDSVGEPLFADRPATAPPLQIPLAEGDYDLDVIATGGDTPAYTIELEQIIPDMTLDPPSPFMFADTQVFQVSAGQEVQIGNDGTGMLEITEISESASAGCSHFDSLFPTTPVSLENGEFESMTITFTPTTRGPHSCDITIVSNVPAGNAIYTVSGTGIGSELVVSPSMLDFPGTHVGDSSAPLQFMLSNFGDPGFDLTIFSVAIPPPDNDEDYLLGGFLSGVIAPGVSEMVSVTFQPQSAGSQPATILIDSDADLNPNPEVEVAGSGTERLIGLSPVTVNFGEVYVGHAGHRQLTITNGGTATLSVTELSISGVQAAEFAITQPEVLPTPETPVEIPGLGSLEVSLECVPTSPGLRTASFVVSSDADNTPQISATLNCTGLDASDLIDEDGFE